MITLWKHIKNYGKPEDMSRKFAFETLRGATGEDGEQVVETVVVDEHHIWNHYLPLWLRNTLETKGLEYPWTFQECIDDWLNEHWGWEVKE